MSPGSFFFKYRSFIPIPLFLILVIFSRTNLISIITGLIFVFLGIFMRIIIQGYTGDWMRGSEVSGEYLLKEGPYSIIRHPFYLANFLIGLRIVIISNLFLYFLIPIFCLIFFFYYFFIVIEEEKYLQNKFGNEYTEYKKNVPAIIPRKIFFKGKRRKNFLKTLITESSTIITILFVIIVFLWRYLWKH